MIDMVAEEMYEEFILDHYRNPKNRGTLKDPEITSKDFNPLCGDELELQIKVDKDNKIEKIRFNGNGCIISQVAASMLTEEVKGKDLSEVSELNKEKILEQLGIPISATRMKCALLCLKVLKTGVYKHTRQQIKD